MTFSYILNPFKTLSMVTQTQPGSGPGSTKRPICPSCSKPTRTCLCTRFSSPKLDNSVAITILQHILEKKHPLNSTRIATLGLKNVQVVSVSDVNLEAKFRIQQMGFGNVEGRIGFGGKDEFEKCPDEIEKNAINLDEEFRLSNDFCEKDGDFRGFEKCPDEVTENMVNLDRNLSLSNDFCEKDANLRGIEKCYDEVTVNIVNIDGKMRLSNDFCENGANFGGFEKCIDEVTDNVVTLDGNLSLSNDFEGGETGENGLVSGDLLERTDGCAFKVQECEETGEGFLEGRVSRGSEEASIDFTIEKYGVVNSCSHRRMEKGESKKGSFEELVKCKEMVENLARGFVVKKLQRKQIDGSFMDEESEEFEVLIPEGSVLLFPTEEELGIGDIEFEIKNLIVLDGTWAKAKRMYNENPWLKVLPHLKLDVGKMSLYQEVRQPKVGYLSTIESIVYSLKALGNDCEDLDGLLDVFESMVGDQRRFKDERLNEEST